MRILVCRPRAGAERTADRLRAMGHEPLVAPVLTTRPIDGPLPALRPDAILLTSAHAVPALARIGVARDTPIFAVGPRTLETIRAAGFDAAAPEGGDAQALSVALARALSPGATVLHLAGRDRKAEPERSLQAAGLQVTVWEVYEAVAAQTLPEQAVAAFTAGRVDAVLHYSRRSASVLAGLADEAGLGAAFEAAAHHCLSGDVAAGLAGVPTERIRIAERPDEDALLCTLASPR